MSEDERRRGPRVVHSFMVRYRRVDAATPQWMLSPLKDFSTQGVRFVSELGLKDGSAVELQLMLPMCKEPLILIGRVAWTESFGDGSLVEHGVEFVEKDTANRTALEDAVAYFLKQKGSGE